MSSKKLTAPDIASSLRNTLEQVRPDVDEANGEALMYPFMNSLRPAHLKEIKAAGFYRSEAALMVIFVSDENDLCFDPKANGYTLFPDYVPSQGGWEQIALKRYCLDQDQALWVTPQKVLEGLEILRPDHRFSLGGIVHVEPTRVPVSGTRVLEEALGHGILELLQAWQNAFAIDLGAQSYQDGFKNLGKLSGSHFEPVTRFPLDAVVISPKDAGKAGSVIEIRL